MKTCGDCDRYAYCQILSDAVELNCYHQVYNLTCFKFKNKKEEEEKSKDIRRKKLLDSLKGVTVSVIKPLLLKE